tara:strand:- start:122 stop:274 length:153 start_codon:yes stop_codon:yes gene_type:complete
VQEYKQHYLLLLVDLVVVLLYYLMEVSGVVEDRYHLPVEVVVLTIVEQAK